MAWFTHENESRRYAVILNNRERIRGQVKE